MSEEENTGKQKEEGRELRRTRSDLLQLLEGEELSLDIR
jgi:hypothetical protein